MPVTDYLERNAKLYGNEVALVELNPEQVDAERMARELGEIPVLRGERLPEIRVLPCGSLRPYAFEKKKILPISERHGVKT